MHRHSASAAIRDHTVPAGADPSKVSGGFSLVEVVLAIAVVAFAFVAIFGLLPVGLDVFRQAMDTSVSAQIVQRIVSDAQQSDFDALVPKNAGSAFYLLPLRSFDDQGSEVASTAVNAIYTVRARGSMPGTADPSKHSDAAFTSLPATGTRFNPRGLTILTIQIVNNSGGRDLTEFIDPQTELISHKKARARSLPVQTFSVAVARNGRVKP